jgi:hypothetical protein
LVNSFLTFLYLRQFLCPSILTREIMLVCINSFCINLYVNHFLLIHQSLLENFITVVWSRDSPPIYETESSLT